ncbi:uncharacterized protein RSE6_12036 [Rhynchosporium secalis]|uniref:Carbohydrate kinase PfkB domain-containing protein n=1 Tax=Rhynchosporium secalis TaxID=38038 RepID=A0A1E1MPJ0_RHYSE|nr:uncharacterized protein RSE6_12036 [Rhynchosporium secalis]
MQNSIPPSTIKTRTISRLGALLEDHTVVTNIHPNEEETVIAKSYSSQMGSKGANTSIAVLRLSRTKPEPSLIKTSDRTDPLQYRSQPLEGGMTPHFLIAQLEIQREAVVQAFYPIMNETEANIFSEAQDEAMRNDNDWKDTTAYFHDLGVPNVVITLGEKGAYYSRNSAESGSVAAETDCEVIDTSGVGDKFVGADFAPYLAQTRE